MLVALMVLIVVSLLATAAIATAVQTNNSTDRDANYKNALEAAEAGLQIAVYRLNMLAPTPTSCLGDTIVTSVPASGWCQSSVTTLGNGSTYQYWTTPIVSTSFTCVGEPLLDSETDGQVSDDVAQRCVTAVGTADGVTARSQIRTAAFTAEQLLPVAGVTGLNDVTESGNAKVNGSSGSNGTVAMSGNASSVGVDLGPAGNYTHSGNSSGGPVTTLSSPIVLSPVSPGNSATTNENSRISNGIYNADNPNATPEVPYDQASSQGVTYTASTRTLSISGNGSLTLGGGLYNFCELDMSGNASLAIAAGVEAEIFVDSPDDPNSGCPSGTGNVNLSGNGTVNPSENPLALQLYVYGLNDGNGTATISGNGNFYGVLYAPNSQVTISGNGIISGGLAGRTVTISGNGFNWDSRAGTLQASSTGLYFRTAWAQCTPAYTTSAPGANC